MISDELKLKRKLEFMREIYRNKGIDLSDDELNQVVYQEDLKNSVFAHVIRGLIVIAAIVLLVYRFW